MFNVIVLITKTIIIAMAIRGSTIYYEINRIMTRHFINQAVSVGIPNEDAINIIDEMINATPDVIQKVYDLLPQDFNKALADSILLGM